MWSSRNARGTRSDKSDLSDSICRDFKRNVCTRGSSCKFRHESESDDTSLQSKVEFCHDYQNRGKCSRNNCKFIHCKREEEEEFKSTGYLPPHVRDQTIQKGVAADMPVEFGNIPICKDNLNGLCKRSKCKFRHVSSQQYDLELGRNIERKNHESKRRFDDDLNGFDRMNSLATSSMENFDRAPEPEFRHMVSLDYEEPLDKKRRMDLVIDYGHNVSSVNMEMLQHENIILKQQMQELKNKIDELSTTNNFLLDQNAQLRMSLKAATGEGGGQGGQPGPGNQQQNAPVVSMDLPSVDQGSALTMTMAAQPMSMSLPVAQLVTTMAGSPIVTSISMAPTQPAGTLVTSMSLAPTMPSAQPIMTTINLAEAMESGQMQPPPSLALQSLPVSSMASLRGVSRPPMQSMALAPNTVQVHETRLVSYPIMSGRPRH